MAESLSTMAIYLGGFVGTLILEWCSFNHINSALVSHPSSLDWSHLNLEKDEISSNGDYNFLSETVKHNNLEHFNEEGIELES